MKASLLKTIRHPEKDKRRSGINLKIITFIICLVISSLLWLMNMMAKKYTEPVDFMVQYQNLPHDKKYIPSSNIVTLKITASGYSLSAFKFGIKQPVLNLDANSFRHRDNRYSYLLNSKTHIEKMEDQLSDDIKVVEASPDTLFLTPSQTQN